MDGPIGEDGFIDLGVVRFPDDKDGASLTEVHNPPAAVPAAAVDDFYRVREGAAASARDYCPAQPETPSGCAASGQTPESGLESVLAEVAHGMREVALAMVAAPDADDLLHLMDNPHQDDDEQPGGVARHEDVDSPLTMYTVHDGGRLAALDAPPVSGDVLASGDGSGLAAEVTPPLPPSTAGTDTTSAFQAAKQQDVPSGHNTDTGSASEPPPPLPSREGPKKAIGGGAAQAPSATAREALLQGGIHLAEQSTRGMMGCSHAHTAATAAAPSEAGTEGGAALDSMSRFESFEDAQVAAQQAAAASGERPSSVRAQALLQVMHKYCNPPSHT